MGQIQKMVLGLLQLGFDVKYIAEELERPERQIIRIRTRLIELGEIEENGQSKRTRRSNTNRE